MTKGEITEDVNDICKKIQIKMLDIQLRISIFQNKIENDQNELKNINLTKFETVYKKVATLKPGDTFGELALLEKNGKRSATIIADQTTYLGVLSEEEFSKYIRKTEK